MARTLCHHKSSWSKIVNLLSSGFTRCSSSRSYTKSNSRKRITRIDYKGAELYRTPTIRSKSLFVLATTISDGSVITSYRDKLRDLMLEGVDVQWGKKCIGYDELDN